MNKKCFHCCFSKLYPCKFKYTQWAEALWHLTLLSWVIRKNLPLHQHWYVIPIQCPRRWWLLLSCHHEWFSSCCLLQTLLSSSQCDNPAVQFPSNWVSHLFSNNLPSLTWILNVPVLPGRETGAAPGFQESEVLSSFSSTGPIIFQFCANFLIRSPPLCEMLNPHYFSWLMHSN